MRIVQTRQRIKSKSYPRFFASLKRQEALKLLEVAKEWELLDTDPMGYAIFRAKGATNNTSCNQTDPVTSFRLKLPKEDWLKFKHLCRAKGTNICHALSNFIQAVLANPELLDHEYQVKIYNFYAGKPRYYDSTKTP